MDPSFPALFLAGIAIVVGVPALMEALASGATGWGHWARVIGGGALVLALFAFAAVFAVSEAHADAASDGERTGFARAPAFSGWWPSLILAGVCVGVAWVTFGKPSPGPALAGVLAALGAAVLAAAAIARRAARRAKLPRRLP